MITYCIAYIHTELTTTSCFCYHYIVITIYIIHTYHDNDKNALITINNSNYDYDDAVIAGLNTFMPFSAVDAITPGICG